MIPLEKTYADKANTSAKATLIATASHGGSASSNAPTPNRLNRALIKVPPAATVTADPSRAPAVDTMKNRRVNEARSDFTENPAAR